MEHEKLVEILSLHKRWLAGTREGNKAYLSGAVLSGAVLRGAVLRGADLDGATLQDTRF